MNRRISLHEAKTHLSRHIAQLREGETILVCKRNVPVAEIRGLRRTRSTRRPFGLARGEFQVPASFFDPLPEEVGGTFDSA